MSTETEIIEKKSDLRLHTWIVIFRGIAVLVVGVFSPWAAALAQWANSGTWPDRIVWIGVILPASAISGFSALNAFLSGSFQTYMEKRKQENGTK